MRRAIFAVLALIACRKSATDAVRPDDPKHLARVTCAIPTDDVFRAPVVVPARCDLAIGKSATLASTMTIGEGARLTFAKGARLIVDGGTLTAKGSATAPIIFSGGDPLVFINTGSAASSPSSLEHVILEDGYGVAIRTDKPGVHLTDVTFRRNHGLALAVERPSALLSAVRVSFQSNGASIDADPETIARFTESTFGDAVFLRGTVEHDVVLPAAPAGFVADTLIVRGATLTFPESADVKMRALAKIEVSPSGASPGALVANKVTFRSAAENAKAGDWSGIELNASPSKLADCKISHAGGPLTMVRSAVRIFADDSKTSIVRTTFADNAGDAIESVTSCGPFEDPVNGNTSTTKMCQVALPPPPSGPVLKIIGSLGAASGTPWAGDVGDTFGHGGLGLVGVGGSGGVGTTSATSSSGAKVTEVSASVTGRLPPEVVRRIVRLNTPRLRHCYDTARKSDPTLAGTVQVKFAIGPSGDVTSASVGGGTLTNPSAVSCIATVFKGLSFPQPESGSVLVSMTHDYKP